jgi:hypothetical protein
MAIFGLGRTEVAWSDLSADSQAAWMAALTAGPSGKASGLGEVRKGLDGMNAREFERALEGLGALGLFWEVARADLRDCLLRNGLKWSHHPGCVAGLRGLGMPAHLLSGNATIDSTANNAAVEV